MIRKTHKIASSILMALIVILLSHNVAQADNDDLAFEFVASTENELVRDCYVFGEIDNYEYETFKYWPSGDLYSCKHIKDTVKHLKPSISASQCYFKGIYTKEMLDKVLSNDELKYYDEKSFYNLGDYCQQVYEELYLREYELNKIIKKRVK